MYATIWNFFYLKFLEFLTGFDFVPQVLENNSFKCLPPRYRAHKLPGQVLLWLEELQSAIANLYIIFDKEFVEAQSKLCDQMGCWTHLPLTICLLGGDNGPDFARMSYPHELSSFPLLYNFVKYRIWSIIVHQQQLEGMFNKYNIKMHPNIIDEVQEARL
ncbi:zinc finger mym-type protein 1-like protein: PROVISIONAL [Gigaspora margarita]|uniref:Zinc finger mym-type protein 1-like protein: PROVISIONAL n=1 Tax=Gigaspora margarita TaxID=4874 RepID=A0A8H4B3X2_GIGMA|nr:zinc finger mym-type protein 1-like protein: PROVISIONAL [Gigaspora margarita]